MANWSDREIETEIEGTFTRVGYPAVNLEQLDAVIVKGCKRERCLLFHADGQWEVSLLRHSTTCVRLCIVELPEVYHRCHKPTEGAHAGSASGIYC